MIEVCLVPTLQRWNAYLVAPAARMLQAFTVGGEYQTCVLIKILEDLIFDAHQ